MKILLINDIGAATGGAELQMLSLRQELRDRGHDVRLFSSSLIPVAGNEFLADYSCFGTNTRLQVLSQTANPSAYLKLRHILKEFQPDVVHVRIFMGQISPLILPLLRDVPCLVQMAMYRAICPKGTKTLPDGSACNESPGITCLQHHCLTPQSWAILMLQRQLWLQWRDAFDLVVALSHRMKMNLEAAGISPVEVVHNGVPARSIRPPLTEPPTVAFAGRLVAEKGADFLLRGFAPVVTQVPNARLLIAGQGVEENALRTLATQLGIAENITWLGHLSRGEMEKHFDSAWVQVVPSLWEEPFGNVTTEAMMRGTAVIACKVGAQPEIVSEGKTGFLVQPHDIGALSSALGKLLGNRELAEQMGQSGHQRALIHFSEDNRTENFLAIYERLRAKYQYQSGSTGMVTNQKATK